jgi:hypothetical protein
MIQLLPGRALCNIFLSGLGPDLVFLFAYISRIMIPNVARVCTVMSSHTEIRANNYLLFLML